LAAALESLITQAALAALEQLYPGAAALPALATDARADNDVT
jgi:hypothetical protein